MQPQRWCSRQRGVLVPGLEALLVQAVAGLVHGRVDPAQRVTLVDAQKANDLFKTLMGEEVEERRNFIFEKGINVRDAIDYGA